MGRKVRLTEGQLRQIIREATQRTGIVDQSDWKHMYNRMTSRLKKPQLWSRNWKNRSREKATEKDISAVKSWLSSNNFGDSKVFDGSDPSWEKQANDKDFLIQGQFTTADDFDYHTMSKGAKEINVVFIKSVGKESEPVYAYVKY